MSVVVAECGCCGQPKFIENLGAAEARVETGEVLFCEACMELPEEEVEKRILNRGDQAKLVQAEVYLRRYPNVETVLLNGHPVIILGGLADK